ncbi:hypothetical protein [Plantactinospora sp. GCM10030261]|uniref:hypothetical protein n=1 Tax=Plantactinospora sp. GCM10030261 TaxID=3273420 RepID=UPI003616B7AB
MSRSGNGDGGPDGGLPDLPPGWGPIVIPDDPSELAEEAAAVRRELRHRVQAERGPWWRRRDLLAFLLLIVALLGTMASLAAVIRTSATRQAGSAATTPSPGNDGAGDAPSRSLPALDLAGERGELVPVRGLLPALIILVDGCDCAGRIDAALLAAPPEVTVVAVATGTVPPAPPTVPPGGHLRRLADPASELRTVLGLEPPAGRPTAVLVGRSATIVRTVPEYEAPEQFLTDLPDLVDR